MNQVNGNVADRTGGSNCDTGISVRQQLAQLSTAEDEQLERLRASLVVAERNARTRKELIAALPDSLPLAPKSLFVGDQVYRADARLVFEIDNREQVLALVAALPALPQVLVKAGSTAFIAEERFVPDERTKAEPIGDVVYRLSTWCGHLNEEFSWWTRINGMLVSIDARTAENARLAVTVRPEHRPAPNGDTETLWRVSGLPNGTMMHWGGGSNRNVVPITVHTARGVSLEEALKGQQFTAASVRTHCSC